MNSQIAAAQNQGGHALECKMENDKEPVRLYKMQLGNECLRFKYYMFSVFRWFKLLTFLLTFKETLAKSICYSAMTEWDLFHAYTEPVKSLDTPTQSSVSFTIFYTVE